MSNADCLDVLLYTQTDRKKKGLPVDPASLISSSIIQCYEIRSNLLLSLYCIIDYRADFNNAAKYDDIWRHEHDEFMDQIMY